MNLRIFQIDAFASEVFRGNPAAVCPLKYWLSDDHLQAIAAENNLSETAFFVADGDEFQLRWFTPTREVDLCGHATLAAGFVLFELLNYASDVIHFQTKSGPLIVTQQAGRFSLDLPARPPEEIDTPKGLVSALGVKPVSTHAARKLMAVYTSEAVVCAITPNFEVLKRLNFDGVIVTAPSQNCDFVSRYFAPKVGINEDPVTGSAHVELTPFWAKRLGKSRMFAKQVSARRGKLICELKGKRVILSGAASLYLTGEINVPDKIHIASAYSGVITTSGN